MAMMMQKLPLLIFLLGSASSTFNADGIEEAYRSWVRQTGFFRHSVFQKARNKLKPCQTIKVDKHRRLAG